jgi:hypothetical protein
MPFLNVVYGSIHSRIKTNDMEDISELRRVIKEEYKNALAEIVAPQLQLYKSYSDEGEKSDALVTDLEDISEEYFKKRKDGGLELEIRTSPPPSKQSSLLNIIPFPPNSGATHEDRSALVNKISDTMNNQMSLLITSPSFTGKTD